MLDASKNVVPKVEFDEIKALAKKQIAGDKKDKKLALENKKLQAQKVELAEFMSVRNQLNIDSIIAENQQLKAFKDKMLRFIEKLGLKEQFDKYMKGDIEKER